MPFVTEIREIHIRKNGGYTRALEDKLQQDNLL